MKAVTPRVHRRRSIRIHVFGLLLLVGALIASPYPASAANDWCSRDPVISFVNAAGGAPYTVDAQVQVPLSALPVAETAELHVDIPINTSASEVTVNDPTFELATIIAAWKSPTPASRYLVDLTLHFPGSTSSFPVRMVITDPHRLTMVVVEGMSGERLRARFEVGY